MSPEKIKVMLSKVVSDLQYIQQSQVFEQVLDTSVVEKEMEALADETILNAKKLKLYFGDAVDKLDEIEAEIDKEMEALLGGGLWNA